MKVTLTNGSSFRVRWQYGEPETMTKHNKVGALVNVSTGTFRVTQCFITKDDPDVKREDAEVVAESKIRRHSEDTPDKEKARRFSMMRALHPHRGLIEGDPRLETPEPFSSEDRALFWKAYLERFPTEEEKQKMIAIMKQKQAEKSGS